ncbi:MAG: hypothetical protein ACYC9S_06165 [Leptospirales bacterium]
MMDEGLLEDILIEQLQAEEQSQSDKEAFQQSPSGFFPKMGLSGEEIEYLGSQLEGMGYLRQLSSFRCFTQEFVFR